MKLSEVELLPDYDPGEKKKDPAVRGKGQSAKREISTGEATKIGKHRGYTFYQSKGDPFQGFNTVFFAVENDTDLPVMVVWGNMSTHGKFKTFKINTLHGRTGSQLKAHDFYRYLMLKLPLILVTDRQSVGGMKVWQKLAAEPSLTVFGYKNGKTYNVDPRDDMETHATKKEPEARGIMKMRLVAHRKM